MPESRGQTFAPLPARAIADEALTALDIRVLAALAVHDRFGANGIGCYASHPRLAGLVCCHLKSLSRSLRVLAELGYIEATQHPLNKRLRVYRVVYLADDKAALKGAMGNETVTNETPIGNQLVADDGPIGNQHFQEAQQYQSDAGLNILGEALSTSGETVNRGSPEGAAPDGAAEKVLRNEESEFASQNSDGQFLGKVQAWLKQYSSHILSDDEVVKITTARDGCQRIVDEDEDEGSQGGIGGWAQRLAAAMFRETPTSGTTEGIAALVGNSLAQKALSIGTAGIL